MPRARAQTPDKFKSLKEDIEKAVTSEDPDISRFDDIDIDVTLYPRDGCWMVKVSRMYDAINLPLKKMMKLAEIFGTMEYGVNGFGYGGCETCDYGSRYGHEFTIEFAKMDMEKFKEKYGDILN